MRGFSTTQMRNDKSSLVSGIHQRFEIGQRDFISAIAFFVRLVSSRPRPEAEVVAPRSAKKMKLG